MLVFSVFGLVFLPFSACASSETVEVPIRDVDLAAYGLEYFQGNFSGARGVLTEFPKDFHSKSDGNYTSRGNNENIFDLWKKFSLNFMENATNVGENCRIAYGKVIEKVYENDYDAVRMLDATAKISSGLLRGNVNQYGDFDECLDTKNAQYCLAEIDLEPIWRKPFTHFKNHIHSHYAIRETLKDPGHRVPGFSLIRWGFCVPEECTSTDVEKALKEKFGVDSRIRPALCQKSNKKVNTEVSYGQIIATCSIRLIVLAVVASTYLHSKLENSKTPNIWTDILMSFSLQKNYKQLTTFKTDNSKDIRAVHGVRALSALALLMSHKVMALFYNPYINRSVMIENLSMGWSVIGRTAILYTDCFMLLSGLLNANAIFSDLDKNSLKFTEKLINRLFRILPNLAAVILFCTYYLPSLGSGPLWPLVVNHHSELCKTNMWKNMLFIHNYFGFEEMCLTHTHQVGIDMQLFLVTPLIVYLIWKNKTIGLWVTAVIAIISTGLRFWASYNYNLSLLVHFGISVSRMFDTARYSYILPTHRATIYLIGVYLAYLLKYGNPKPMFCMSKFKLFIMWMVFLCLGFSVWFGPTHMSRQGYIYNKWDAAVYGAVSPIFWGTAVAWVIYATNKNCGSILGHILEWKHFQRFTKISYAVYLVQFPVFFYNVGLTRNVAEYSPFLILPIVETSLIILVSVVLTLFVEMPFQNLRKIWLTRRINVNNNTIKCAMSESERKTN